MGVPAKAVRGAYGIRAGVDDINNAAATQHGEKRCSMALASAAASRGGVAGAAAWRKDSGSKR